MSYITLKKNLTGASQVKENNTLGLNECKRKKDQLYELLDGVTNTILIPAKKLMTGYIDARITYLTNIGEDIRRGANVEGKLYHFRSPTTGHLLSAQNDTRLGYTYANYDTCSGTLTDWKIEKWANYDVDEDDVFTYTATTSTFIGSEETYDDLSQTKLDEVSHLIDITNVYTLSDLQQAVSAFDYGMEWIWATTDPSNSNCPHYGTYNSWGIRDEISNLDISITAITKRISFDSKLVELNNLY